MQDNEKGQGIAPNALGQWSVESATEENAASNRELYALGERRSEGEGQEGLRCAIAGQREIFATPCSL